MIDINILRESPDKVKENLKKRFQEDKIKLVDEILKIDETWRKLKYDEDKFRSERNKISKSIAEAVKKGNKKEADKLKKEAKEIPEKIEKIQVKRKKYEDKIKEILMKLPNMIHKSVPIGKDESEAKVLRKFGKIPQFDFKPKSHFDLVRELGGVDEDKGAKVSGSRFYYLLGDLVFLNHALQRFAMDFLKKKGYLGIQPPYMLNKEAMSGAVSLEDFKESIYKIEGEDLYLIGTSEHALAAYHKDEILNLNKPLKYFGISSCFRKEAGSHDKDTKGIFRVHRFEKVEQFVFCREEDEEELFNELINNQEEIFKLLEIPYKVIALPSGDFSGSMARTHDLEGWYPAENEYRELGSTSSAEKYQARKLNIRYQNKNNKLVHAYTLNGTAMTVQRTITCILENFQQKDGTISIPKVLQPYMNGMKKIEVVKK